MQSKTNNHVCMPVSFPKILSLFFGVLERTKNRVVRIAKLTSVGNVEKLVPERILSSPTPKKNALMKNRVLITGRLLLNAAFEFGCSAEEWCEVGVLCIV